MGSPISKYKTFILTYHVHELINEYRNINEITIEKEIQKSMLRGSAWASGDRENTHF